MVTALVVGVTGGGSGLGKKLALEIHKLGGNKVRGLLRNFKTVDQTKQKAIQELKQYDIDLFQGDLLDKKSLYKAVAGCDVVACVLLGDDETFTTGQKNLIDVCKEEQVKCYLPADFGIFSTVASPKIKDIPFAQKDDITRQYLQKVQQPYFSVVCGFFYEYFTDPEAEYFNFKDRVFQYYGQDDDEIDLSSVQDVATYTAACMCDPNTWPIGGTLKLNSEQNISFGKVIRYIKEIDSEFKITRLGDFKDLEHKYYQAYAKNPKDDTDYANLSYIYALQANKMKKLDNYIFPNVKVQLFKDYLKEVIGQV